MNNHETSQDPAGGVDPGDAWQFGASYEWTTHSIVGICRGLQLLIGRGNALNIDWRTLPARDDYCNEQQSLAEQRLRELDAKGARIADIPSNDAPDVFTGFHQCTQSGLTEMVHRVSHRIHNEPFCLNRECTQRPRAATHPHPTQAAVTEAIDNLATPTRIARAYLAAMTSVYTAISPALGYFTIDPQLAHELGEDPDLDDDDRLDAAQEPLARFRLLGLHIQTLAPTNTKALLDAFHASNHEALQRRVLNTRHHLDADPRTSRNPGTPR